MTPNDIAREILKKACIHGSYCTPSGCGTKCQDKEEVENAIASALTSYAKEVKRRCARAAESKLGARPPHGYGNSLLADEIAKAISEIEI